MFHPGETVTIDEQSSDKERKLHAKATELEGKLKLAERQMREINAELLQANNVLILKKQEGKSEEMGQRALVQRLQQQLKDADDNAAATEDKLNALQADYEAAVARSEVPTPTFTQIPTIIRSGMVEAQERQQADAMAIPVVASALEEPLEEPQLQEIAASLPGLAAEKRTEVLSHPILDIRKLTRARIDAVPALRHESRGRAGPSGVLLGSASCRVGARSHYAGRTGEWASTAARRAPAGGAMPQMLTR